jgi:hypothetical protein
MPADTLSGVTAVVFAAAALLQTEVHSTSITI